MMFLGWLFVILFAVSCKKDRIEHSEKKIDPPTGFYSDGGEFQIVVDHEFNLVLSYTESGEVDFEEFKDFLSSVSTFEFDTEHSNLEIGESYQIHNTNGEFDLYFTQRPIVLIQTFDLIPDEPKTQGTLTMIGDVDEPYTVYCGVEYRGQSSLAYEKKSLGLELWNDVEGYDKRRESVLGMREDDDWIIDAMAIDPLRMRNPVSLRTWHDIFTTPDEDPDASMGCDAEFVEYFVNGSYQGIGGFLERVDRKQLELKEYEGELRGELYKADGWGGATTFDQVYPIDNTSETWAYFKQKYPDPDEFIDWSNLYELIDFVANSNDEDFIAGVEDLFDFENLCDNFIFMNLAKGKDNRGKNLYIARRDQDEPYYFVPWDYDAAWGLEWDGRHDIIWVYLMTNNLYNRLLETNAGGFENILVARWNELKGGDLSYSSVQNRMQIEWEINVENLVYEREQIRWSNKLPRVYSEGDFDHFMEFTQLRYEFFQGFIDDL